MGKPTGFLEYKRKEGACVPPEERVRCFSEFHLPLDPGERRRQGGRCMDCGVPFCQSGMTLGGMVTGCPLHNLIPEWNDGIYTGSLDEAAARLMKTNSFPEFTGRVCPALCEKACICGRDGDPVTIRDNELYIIEEAFRSGAMRPRLPARRSGRRVAVVGSGPAGLAAADRLNRRGHSVTVFERDDRPGGLLMYGIPNMKLDKSVVLRRIELMRAEGVEFVTGADVGRDIAAEKLVGEFDAVALCCGAREARALPAAAEMPEGVCFAVDYLTGATRALLGGGEPELCARGKRVVIVGGGDTGNDCVATCLRQGCAGVVQIEMMPKPPECRQSSNPWPEWPKVLKTDYGQQEAAAVFGADPRIFGSTVSGLVLKDGWLAGVKLCEVAFHGRTPENVPGTERGLPAELLIVAAGFVGAQSYVPEAFGVAVTARRTLQTDGGYATSVPGVFAAGDARRGQSLVVWAISEGRACAAEIDRRLMGYTPLE